jgi:antitoxin PrlF
MALHKARVTSKGQITIPRDVRRLLGVKAGDSVVFEDEGSSIQVRPASKISRFEKYRGIGNPGLPSGKKAIIAYVRQLRDS